MLFPIILFGVVGILMVGNREKKEEGKGKERWARFPWPPSPFLQCFPVSPSQCSSPFWTPPWMSPTPWIPASPFSFLYPTMAYQSSSSILFNTWLSPWVVSIRLLALILPAKGFLMSGNLRVVSTIVSRCECFLGCSWFCSILRVCSCNPLSIGGALRFGEKSVKKSPHVPRLPGSTACCLPSSVWDWGAFEYIFVEGRKGVLTLSLSSRVLLTCGPRSWRAPGSRWGRLA